jgi:hypothetical protein
MSTKNKKTIKSSSGDNRHPYLNDMNWINGSLCFWRDNPGMYSKETIERFENNIKQLKANYNKYYELG